MIIMDPPRQDVFRGRPITTAHLISTLHSAEGTAELLAFARRIGLRPAWLQHPGTYREHFDLMGARCEAAKLAGAVEDQRLLGETLAVKRGAA